ncbi:DUF4190 domain-containing protein [Williamsia sterculiae]|uniref:DUF4190 domain-containing protein n=1 Tax=Williamsia sterculiae TaxID=1344003 RepID=A0A1N7FUJ6_9NOCA|nr:DUF4190 domain-containing protein [Williamsia sterculiae]SIS04010.1 protein of unknown function [Williamsia sterculiae]
MSDPLQKPSADQWAPPDAADWQTHPYPGEQSAYGPVGYQPPVYAYAPPAVVTTNGKAIAALICGIAGFVTGFLILGIPAVVLGRMASREIVRAGGTQTGDGLAVAGRILGWIQVAIMVVGVLLVVGFIVLVVAGSH